MRPLYALVATFGLVFLAAPVSAGLDANAATDPAGCAGAVCDAINRVCQKVGGGSCVGADAAKSTDPTACAGAVCDAINRVCHCLGSDASDATAIAGTKVQATETEPAVAGARCMGLPCDVINFVCYTAVKAYCVG